MGSPTAIKELSSAPECPEAFQYLIDWSRKLFGRSGIGMTVAPLSYQEVEAWTRLMDLGTLEPWEVDALMMLDSVQRNPDIGAEDIQEPEEVPEPVATEVVDLASRRRGEWPTSRKPPKLQSEG